MTNPWLPKSLRPYYAENTIYSRVVTPDGYSTREPTPEEQDAIDTFVRAFEAEHDALPFGPAEDVPGVGEIIICLRPQELQ